MFMRHVFFACFVVGHGWAMLSQQALSLKNLKNCDRDAARCRKYWYKGNLLHHAVRFWNEASVRDFVQYPGFIYDVDSDGQTPLALAVHELRVVTTRYGKDCVSKQHRQVIRHLLNAGSRISCDDTAFLEWLDINVPEILIIIDEDEMVPEENYHYVHASSGSEALAQVHHEDDWSLCLIS